MAQGKKYATLPDLDSAPDVYETPEVEGDNDADSTSTRSGSPSKPSKDNNDQRTSGIDHQQLDPDYARNQFNTARVDARDVDFSDRIDSSHRSYRPGRTRTTKHGTIIEVYGALSDDDEETLDTRLSRLRRELEEVQAEIQRSSEEAKDHSTNQTQYLSDIQEMAQIFQRLQLTRGRPFPTETEDKPSVHTDHSAENGAATVPPIRASNWTADSVRPSTVSIDEQRLLAKAADFDSRLAALESTIGAKSIRGGRIAENQSSRGILPSLEAIESKISALAAISTPSLDSMAQRIHQLTQNAERLQQARKDAREARDTPRPRTSGPRTDGTLPSGSDRSITDADNEQDAKLEALYETIATIETLSPLLPAVLDRLKSLRLVHADAATASDNLSALEKRQAEAAEDISNWRTGLEKIEQAMAAGDGTSTENVSTVQAWVKDLEARIQKLN